MNIILYNVSDAPNIINKKLGTGLTIENVRFTDDNALDVLNPSVLFSLTKTENNETVPYDISDYSCYNYFYIPKFGRYYYMTEMSTEGGLVRITGKVDALYSFRKDIYGSEQYLVRSEKYRNRYIVDNLLPIHSQNSYDVQPLDNGENVFVRDCNYVILETVGKGGTPT